MLRHIVESRILAVEDIQPAVVRWRTAVQAQPVQLLVDTVMLVAGTVLVVGTVEVDMVLALARKQHRDWAPERQLHSGLMAAVQCMKVESAFRNSVDPCS